ncbi:DUF2065 domain-containing protein [Terrarubrum flagellatum]|uniref:DUF2065 domain-containing protein n=1 Tax=Terrirubrum flagellatum TaxID=2895980 RepID=UPI003144D42B
MKDFGAAIGLAFAIEGLLLAAFPTLMRRSMAEAALRPDSWLRAAGLISAVVGVVLVWAARAIF